MEAQAGRVACSLDAVIHERRRLAIVIALAASPAATFTELKRALDMTDGNLSVHARRLEEVGYISRTKLAVGNEVRTEFRLTPAGRRALDAYLAGLRAIVNATGSHPCVSAYPVASSPSTV